MELEKTIGLVDCNSFFCSCERLFRPELKSQPVIVLSNNDGCTIARTREVKELGIPMAAPYFKVKDLCANYGVTVFSSNFSIYTNLSKRVMSLLKMMIPTVEVYSVDEAWLDLTGVKNPFAFAEKIQRDVLKLIGIPVTVGLGRTKTLAKVANNLAKQKSLPALDNVEISLDQVQIGDVWGVGRKNAVKMRGLGIKTAQDLRDYQNEEQIKKIFTKVGWQTQQELRGKSYFPFGSVREKKKQILCSRTFAIPIHDIEGLKGALATFVSSAASDLRAQGDFCYELAVFTRPDRFDLNHYEKSFATFRFDTGTTDTRKMIKGAFHALERIYYFGTKYKKAGVALIDIGSEIQTNLFFEGEGEKVRKLMMIMDLINDHEGKNTLRSAACDIGAWSMNRNFKSPRYLTSWCEIPEVF